MNAFLSHSTSPTPPSKPLLQQEISNKVVLILGLGLHGGGVAMARYLASKNPSRLIVMDTRDAKTLAPSIEKLKDICLEYRLGKHDQALIDSADLVVKNPAVHYKHPALKNKKHITTDIALFLSAYRGTVYAITGTKGKTSLTQALGRLLNIHCYGNNTNSPLNILLSEALPPDRVLLELSSFQIGDLARYTPHLLSRPSLCVLTNIYKDHMDYYQSHEQYIADKYPLFAQCSKHSTLVLPSSTLGEEWSQQKNKPHKTKNVYFHGFPLAEKIQGTYIKGNSIYQKALYGTVRKIGDLSPTLLQNLHKENIETLATICQALNHTMTYDTKQLIQYFSLPYHKEHIATIDGRIIINDSSATIPEAMNLVQYNKASLIVICGGTDKNLQAQALVAQCLGAKSVVLFEGSFTKKSLPIFQDSNCRYYGPYAHLEECFSTAFKKSIRGDTILFSPGCASFESFVNAHSRGKIFTELVLSYAQS